MNGENEPATRRQPSVMITAILAITAIELVAIHHGINGKLFALSAFVIGGIAGVSFKGLFDFLRGRKGTG